VKFIWHKIDYKKQKNILEEFDMDPIGSKSAQYKQNWLDHAGHLKQLLDYRPSCRKTKKKRPVKRLRDWYSVEVETEFLLSKYRDQQMKLISVRNWRCALLMAMSEPPGERIKL
jgi:hypothetical protein